MPAHWQWQVLSARTSHEPQAEPHVQPVTTKPANSSGGSLDPKAGGIGVEVWGLQAPTPGNASPCGEAGNWGPGHHCPKEMGSHLWGREKAGHADLDPKDVKVETSWS